MTQGQNKFAFGPYNLDRNYKLAVYSVREIFESNSHSQKLRVMSESFNSFPIILLVQESFSLGVCSKTNIQVRQGKWIHHWIIACNEVNIIN